MAIIRPFGPIQNSPKHKLQGSLAIDWSRAPRGLCNLFINNDPLFNDLIAGSPTRSSASLRITGRGTAFDPTVGAGNRWVYSLQRPQNTTQWTQETLVYCASALSIGHGFCGVQDGTPTAGTHDRETYYDSGSTHFVSMLFDGASQFVIGTTTPTVGNYYHIVAVADGSTFKIYVNGKQEGSIAVANAGFTGYTNSIFTQGYANGLQNTAFKQLYSLMATRAWTAQEVMARFADPFGFLVPANIPIGAPPAAAGTPNIVEQSFFDPVVKLKRPSEFSQGPFAGTSPALATTFATSSFFDQVVLKRPIISVPDVTPPEPPRLAGDKWFDPVPLKRPTIDNAPILFQPATVAATIVEQPFFDQTALKRPSDFTQGPFAGTSPALATTFATSSFFEPSRLKQPIIDKPSDVAPLVTVIVTFAPGAWFEPAKLLKVPERLQEAFGAPFPVSVQTAPFFEPVRLRLPPPAGFEFLKATTVVSTIQNALVDWFPAVKLKQPILNPGLVVYFPTPTAPTVSGMFNPTPYGAFVNFGKFGSS